MRVLTMCLILIIGGVSYGAVKGDDVFTPTVKISDSSQYVCYMSSGDTKNIRYKSSTRESAMEKVIDKCISIRTKNYIKRDRIEPTEDRQMAFAEACWNATNCTK